MAVRTVRIAAGLAALGAALWGCVYTFDNPVEKQSNGTVAGQLVVGTAAAGQSLAGAQIDLLWSNASLTVDAQGKFTFLDLPAGMYRLKVTVPPPPDAPPNQLPVEFARGQIYLPATPGGTPDSILLGQIRLDLAGVVSGTVVGAGAGAVVGAFEPEAANGAVGEFEGYSTTTNATGGYRLTLPFGKHEIWASTASASASLLVDVPAGQTLVGQDLTPAAPDGGATADLIGYAVIGDLGAGATADQLQAILADGGLSIGLQPSGGVPPPSFAFGTPSPAAGVASLQVEQQLLPGTLYQVTVGPPASLGTDQLVPAVLTNIPAIAGHSTFLQQIFILSVASAAANLGPADAGSPALDAGPPDAGPIDAGLLLVDNDGNTPPNGISDPSLTYFKNWLGPSTPLYEVPSDGSDPNDVDAADPTLAGVATLVYFSGDNYPPISTPQMTALQNWLNQGGHTLILFTADLIYSFGANAWATNESNAFLSQDVGALTDLDDPQVWSATAGDQQINSTSAIVSGSAALPAFAGQQWTMTRGVLPGFSSDLSIVEPVTSNVDVLATVPVDPTQSGVANTAEPVALGHKHVGTAGTSTVVWVGFTVEDIQANLPAPNGTLQTFLAAVQAYAGF